MSSVHTPQRPPLEDVRVRLEGGLELLQSAEPQYRLLTQIKGRKWKPTARAKENELRWALNHDDLIVKALERVERLHARDGWADEFEPVVVAKKVRELREQLLGTMRAQLWGNTPGVTRTFEASLMQMLAVIQLAPPRRADEAVLLEGRVTRRTSAWLSALLPAMIGAVFGGAPAAMIAFFGALFGIWWWASLGRYQLLPDRLLYTARGEDPVELKLSSLGSDDVQMGPLHAGVVFQGPKPLEFPVADDAALLAAKVALHKGPLKDCDGAVDSSCMVLKAFRATPSTSKGGLALFTDSSVTWLAEGAAPRVLAHLTGMRLAVPITEQQLFEELSRLKPGEREKVLAKVNTCGGLYLHREQIEAVNTAVPSLLLRLRSGGETLNVTLSALDREKGQLEVPWAFSRFD